jgi:tripartite ATP-independent transporter DctM subunit
MEPTTLAIILVIAALALIIIGFPIAFSLGGVAVVGAVLYYGPGGANMFVFRVFTLLQDYVLLAIPLFVFMGYMLESTGIAVRMYRALRLIMGRLPGGLALATVATGTMFAAATGVVGASVVTLGVVALPAMLGYLYDRRLVAGTVCAAGTLGILIPPSILIIMYGPMAGLSVGQLFASTLVPGLLLSLLYLLTILIYCQIRPHAGPPLSGADLEFTVGQRVLEFGYSAVPTLLLIGAVLGTIIMGIAAPTEAAAVGAFATLILAALYRQLSLKRIFQAAMKTLEVSSMIFIVTIGASLFTGLFIRLGGGGLVQGLFLGLDIAPLLIIVIMLLIVIVLGMFIDWIGILLICVPLFTPVVAQLQFDPIWFATLMIIALQISYLTPPFALSIFYLRGVSPPEMTTSEMYQGILPFLGLQLLMLIALLLWPPIATWLPAILYR